MQTTPPFIFTLQSHGSTIEIVLMYERDHMAYPKDYWRIAVWLEQHGRNCEAENMMGELYLHVFGGQFGREGTQDVLKKVVA